MKIEIEFSMKETSFNGVESNVDFEEVVGHMVRQFWWAYADMQQNGDIR